LAQAFDQGEAETLVSTGNESDFRHIRSKDLNYVLENR
jgi:hypothetical protein